MSTSYGFKCKTCDEMLLGTRNKNACIDLFLLKDLLHNLFSSKHSYILHVCFTIDIHWNYQDGLNDPFKFVSEHSKHDLIIVDEYDREVISG